MQISEYVDINEHYEELKQIWASVADEIMKRVCSYGDETKDAIHYLLREEMIYEYSKLLIFIETKVVNDRKKGRNIDEIVIEDEKNQCFSEFGLSRIEATAKCCYENIWQKLMQDRWKPRTKRLLENKSRKAHITDIPHVDTNHFITRSFIKKYWQKDNYILLHIRQENGIFSQRTRLFSQWGKKNGLYSDNLEHYFGLLEGDSSKPIEMILKMIPLNEQQKESLIAFIVIHYFRNPFVMTGIKKSLALQEGIKDLNDSKLAQAYERIFKSNDFYSIVTNNLLENKWVIIRSKISCFPLSDCPAVVGKYKNDRSYMIFPLTPKEVFIILPEIDKRENAHKIVPYNCYVDEHDCTNIVSYLISISYKEYITNPDSAEIKIGSIKYSEIDFIDDLCKVCI